MKAQATYTTGSRRGYVCVKDRGVESPIAPIPDTKGMRGNQRWALDYLKSQGCTHYTVAGEQGAPKGWSTQYCYSVYTGYSD